MDTVLKWMEILFGGQPKNAKSFSDQLFLLTICCQLNPPFNHSDTPPGEELKAVLRDLKKLWSELTAHHAGFNVGQC